MAPARDGSSATDCGSGVTGMSGWTSDRGGFWRRWRTAPAVVSPPGAGRVDDGVDAFQEGRYGDAERLLVGALKRAERSAPESTDLAVALGKLADLYRAQARYEEAEPLYRRAIAIEEMRHGSQHSRMARVLNNLALVYRAQGLYTQAEPLCQRALAIAERDRKSTRLNSSHLKLSRMPSSA